MVETAGMGFQEMVEARRRIAGSRTAAWVYLVVVLAVLAVASTGVSGCFLAFAGVFAYAAPIPFTWPLMDAAFSRYARRHHPDGAGRVDPASASDDQRPRPTENPEPNQERDRHCGCGDGVVHQCKHQQRSMGASPDAPGAKWPQMRAFRSSAGQRGTRGAESGCQARFMQQVAHIRIADGRKHLIGQPAPLPAEPAPRRGL